MVIDYSIIACLLVEDAIFLPSLRPYIASFSNNGVNQTK